MRRPLAAIVAFSIAVSPAAVLADRAPAAQQRRGGQGSGAESQAPPPTGETVRVKSGHANVHTGPNTSNEVLVLPRKDTVLAVLSRRGEWIQVALTPDVRKSGLVMRWYKHENNGWIHDSMIDVVKTPAK